MNPDLSKLMEEAKKMQDRMLQAQKELESMLVTGAAGGGIVKVEMTGRYQVKKVMIDEDLIEGDVNMLEDLVAAAINDAVNKVEKETRGKMAGLTAGLDLPSDLGSIR